jgi:hypothetical protein
VEENRLAQSISALWRALEERQVTAAMSSPCQGEGQSKETGRDRVLGLDEATARNWHGSRKNSGV